MRLSCEVKRLLNISFELLENDPTQICSSISCKRQVEGCVFENAQIIHVKNNEEGKYRDFTNTSIS